MTDSRPGFGQRLRDNWLEWLVLAILLAALLWIATTARQIWQITNAAPTPDAPAVAVDIPTPGPGTPVPLASSNTFDGQTAAELIDALVALGPRPVGSEANAAAADLIAVELRRAAWGIQELPFEIGGVTHNNVIARSGSGAPIILATHFDSSPVSNNDADTARQSEASPGANDGGSGVGVLLELARALDKEKLTNQVWLVFLDGRYAPGDDGTTSTEADSGATALAQALPENISAAIVLDLVGSAEASFFIDPGADTELSQRLWSIAEAQGFARWFVAETSQEPGYSGLTPFTALGMPAAAIIDNQYPFLRTTQDTQDKLSSSGLERVGRVLEVLLETNQQ